MSCHVVSCHVMSHVVTAKQTKQMRIPFDPESLSKKHFIIYTVAAPYLSMWLEDYECCIYLGIITRDFSPLETAKIFHHLGLHRPSSFGFPVSRTTWRRF